MRSIQINNSESLGQGNAIITTRTFNLNDIACYSVDGICSIVMINITGGIVINISVDRRHPERNRFACRNFFGNEDMYCIRFSKSTWFEIAKCLTVGFVRCFGNFTGCDLTFGTSFYLHINIGDVKIII